MTALDTSAIVRHKAPRSAVEHLANQAKCLHVVTLAKQLISRGLHAALGELIVTQAFKH